MKMDKKIYFGWKQRLVWLRMGLIAMFVFIFSRDTETREDARAIAYSSLDTAMRGYVFEVEFNE